MKRFLGQAIMYGILLGVVTASLWVLLLGSLPTANDLRTVAVRISDTL